MELLGNISCRICNKVFNEKERKPLNLPCGDIFCQMCLTQEIQPKQYFKCKECQEVHQDLQIGSLSVAKRLLEIAKNLNGQVSKVVCECKKGKSIDFFCKREDKFCCVYCYLKCQDHKEQTFELQNIKSELQSLKEIIEVQILQKSQIILNELNIYLDTGDQQILYGDQLHTISKKLFQFIKELQQIELKTEYQQYLKQITEIGKEERQEQQKQIKNIKQEQIEEVKLIQKELSSMQENFKIFNEEKQKYDQKFQEVDQIKQQLLNMLQNQAKIKQEIIQKYFDPEKFHTDIQLSENNQMAKNKAQDSRSGLVNFAIQDGKIYEIEFQVVSYHNMMIGIIPNNQN